MRFPNEDTRRYYYGAYGGRATDAAIADYAIGALPLEKMLAITNRLETDAAFRAMATPLIRALMRPIRDPVPGETDFRPRTPEEKAAEWKRFEAMTAGDSGPAKAGESDKSAANPASDGSAAPARRRWRAWRKRPQWRRNLKGGVGLAMVLGVIAVAAYFGSREPVRDLGENVEAVAEHLGAIELEIAKYGQGRASVIGVFKPRVAETYHESMRVRPADGSEVLVRPLSRLTYEAESLVVMNAALDGEAVFEVRNKMWAVNTREATIYLSEGRYAIRTAMHGGELQLAIGLGMANVHGKTVYRTGDYVTLTREPFSVRSTKDSTGFPSLDMSRLVSADGGTGQ
jgi:hypothetical protein